MDMLINLIIVRLESFKDLSWHSYQVRGEFMREKQDGATTG